MAVPTIRAKRVQNPTRRVEHLTDDALFELAIKRLEQRLFQRGCALDRPKALSQFFRLQLTGEEEECFAAAFLDAQLHFIAFEQLFRGTVNTTTVFPRVVVKRALKHNAVAIVVAHNHTSGHTRPSTVDKQLTQQLKNVLAIIDVQLLDHFVIGKGEPFSFAAASLL